MERIAELKNKEVVNICDGARMGYVSDVELDVATGRITALIIPGPTTLGSLFGRGSEYVVSWDEIERIGDDIILVRMSQFCSEKGKNCRQNENSVFQKNASCDKIIKTK